LNEVKSGAGIVAARSFPDFAALIPGYAFDCSCKNCLLRIFSAIFDRFSTAVASCVELFSSKVSRQQPRCFNDLHGLSVLNSATAFDNRRRIRLKAKILLT